MTVRKPGKRKAHNEASPNILQSPIIKFKPFSAVCECACSIFEKISDARDPFQRSPSKLFAAFKYCEWPIPTQRDAKNMAMERSRSFVVSLFPLSSNKIFFKMIGRTASANMSKKFKDMVKRTIRVSSERTLFKN